jgi:hypothetical protein
MIRKVSKKRAQQNRQYAKVRLEYLETHPVCEANLQECLKVADEIHHRKGRTNDLLCNPEYFLAVCWNCHVWIELHPKEAKELGFSLSRLHS